MFTSSLECIDIRNSSNPKYRSSLHSLHSCLLVVPIHYSVIHSLHIASMLPPLNHVAPIPVARQIFGTALNTMFSKRLFHHIPVSLPPDYIRISTLLHFQSINQLPRITHETLAPVHQHSPALVLDQLETYRLAAGGDR